MSRFARAAVTPSAPVVESHWASAEWWLDDLTEISWLLRMARLGLGFNPDLLALTERVAERADVQATGTLIEDELHARGAGGVDCGLRTARASNATPRI